MLSKNANNCNASKSKIYNSKEKKLDNSKCKYKKLKDIKPVENKEGFKPVVVKTREHKLFEEITLQHINNVRCRLNPTWNKYNLYMKMREAIIHIPLELDDYYKNIIINHLLEQYEEEDKTLFKIVYEIEAPAQKLTDIYRDYLLYCEDMGLKEEGKSRFYKLFDKMMKDLNKTHHEWHRSKYYKVELIKSPNRHN